MSNVESMQIPADMFSAEAERRVRLALLVSEFVKQAQLQAKLERACAH